MLQLRAIWSCRRPRSYRRRSISLIFRMDTFSWATKSPPRPVEELHSPVVQHLRPDELFFRKSFRHVNNDSDGGDFSIHLFSESLIHMPGIFIQNLSEHPIHIARNPHAGEPCSANARANMSILSWILLGLIAGFLGSKIVN